jgi:hypothetical protein
MGTTIMFKPTPVYCDPAGGERIQEITGGVKANNSVESGIDFINAKIERRQFGPKKKTRSAGNDDKCHAPDDFFSEYFDREVLYQADAYRYNAWVNIVVGILIRNIARAGFVIKRGGNEVISGTLYDLFRRPNTALSRYDLWKETAAWWSLEGEACNRKSLRWFGSEYAGGLPQELFVLNPRKLRHEGYDNGQLYGDINTRARRWFYHTGKDVLKERGKDANPRGDVWYRPKNMIATTGSAASSSREPAETGD